MRLQRCLSAIVIAVIAIPSIGHADEAGAEKLKAMLDASLHPMLARELPDLAYKTVVLGDDLIRLDLPSELRPVVEDVRTGIWSIYMKHPEHAFELSCLVFFQTNYVANGIANLMQRSSAALIELEQVPEGTSGQSGYLHSHFYGDDLDIVFDAESIAIFDRDAKNVAIYARGAGGLLDDSTLACVSSQFGYRETFTRIMTRMIASGVRPDLNTVPYFAALDRVFINDRPSGFQLSWLEETASGDTFHWTSSSTLAVGGAVALIEDNTVTGTARSDGSQIEASSKTITLSGMSTDVSIKADPSEPGQWSIEGTVRGEAVSTTIRSAAPLVSPLGMQQLLRAVAQQAVGAAASYPSWNLAKPTEIARNTVRRTEQGVDLDYAGSITASFELGPDGSLPSSSYSLAAGGGLIRFRSERQHVVGRVPALSEDSIVGIDD